MPTDFLGSILVLHLTVYALVHTLHHMHTHAHYTTCAHTTPHAHAHMHTYTHIPTPHAH